MMEIEAQDMKNMTGKAIFEYAKFNMSGVASAYAKEKVQQENVARFAATGGDASSGSQPEKDGAACQELPPQQPSEHEDETEEEVESKIAQKERLLKEAREKHVRAAMHRGRRLATGGAWRLGGTPRNHYRLHSGTCSRTATWSSSSSTSTPERRCATASTSTR